jgi:hypothetical protein
MSHTGKLRINITPETSLFGPQITIAMLITKIRTIKGPKILTHSVKLYPEKKRSFNRAKWLA